MNVSIEKVYRPINLVVVHCAATRPSMDIGAKEIDQWHKDRGFNKIGYHFVIRRNGEIEKGRDIIFAGAHVAGYNYDSIGICLVGGVDDNLKPEKNFTKEQFTALLDLLKKINKVYPRAKILGHRDIDDRKACPSFDVKKWLEDTGLTKGDKDA